MKVELQSGDTIAIPEGCKATIRNGSVVFEKEEKLQEFKDGDVLTSLFDNKVVFIFKKDELKQKDNRNGYYVCHTSDYVIDVSTKDSSFFCGHKKDVRLATDEEKQFLFDKMKEQGLRWNAEEKRVENIRWRAKKGEGYYFIDNSVHISSHQEDDDGVDNQLWNAYNYFRTREQAKKAAEVMKEALRKHHEEIGE